MIDADSNLGDYTAIRSLALPAIPAPGGGDDPPVLQKLKVTSTGNPARRKTRTVTLTVRNGSFQPVAGARVRVSGAGVKAVTKTTSATGKVSFKIRATRYPGKVTFRVTKAGFIPLNHEKPVRPV